MKIRLSFKPKIILLTQGAGVLLNGLSVYFLSLTKEIVNNDLYHFGLRYSNEWATQYWTYYLLTISFVGSAITVAALTVVLVLVYTWRRRGSALRSLSLCFAVSGIGLTAFSIFWYARLDQFVHSQLYNYGLVFSYEWATKYWTYSYSILALQTATIIIAAFSSCLFFFATRVQTELNSIRFTQYAMLFSGTVAFIFSVLYNSSILALIGLGLTFWGGLLIYIQPVEYIQKSLLESTVLSSLEPLKEILVELNYKGNAVYLPPRYFKDPEESKICFLKQEDAKPPLPSQIQGHETQLLIDAPQAILISPPGLGLLKLFERNLNTSLTRVDIHYLQQYLQQLLVEKLEIADEASMEIQDDTIKVFLEDSLFSGMYTRLQNQPDMFRQLGTPISSAVACGLAKVTGKLVSIIKDQRSDNGRSILIEYSLQDIPKEE